MDKTNNSGSPYVGLILIILIVSVVGSSIYFFDNKKQDIDNKNEDKNNKNTALNVTVSNGYKHYEKNDKITIDITMPKVDDKYVEINNFIKNLDYNFKVNGDADLAQVRSSLYSDYDKQKYPVTYFVDYETYKNGNIVTIQIEDIYGIDDSGEGIFLKYYVNYDSTTAKIVYLNDYLTLKNKTLIQANETYKNGLSSYEEQGDENGAHICEYKPLTNETPFYITNGKLYVVGDSCRYDWGGKLNEVILID